MLGSKPQTFSSARSVSAFTPGNEAEFHQVRPILTMSIKTQNQIRAPILWGRRIGGVDWHRWVHIKDSNALEGQVYLKCT